MAANWTDKQTEAICAGERSILVSAAAGSGKTAVLVERILRKITDKEHPVDIDRLVVVTFTKAAAAEMRQRIRAALDDMLEREPGNERLQRQLALIHNAKITTIDSFCLNIVRNYFSDIDIDPGFRTADEGEIQLLENDVMDELLEERYAEGNKEFEDFVDAYGAGKDDSKISELILKIYRAARSCPWEDEWYEDCKNSYSIKNTDDLERHVCVRALWEDLRNRLEDFDARYDEIEAVCQSIDGPLGYYKTVQEDHQLIKMLLAAESFAEFARRVNLSSFGNIGRCDKSADEQKKAYVKGVRDEFKDFITKNVRGKLIAGDMSKIFEDILYNAPSVELMTQLAQEFSERMQAQKRSRNIIDFNDMEHMALNVLVERKDRESRRTEAAETLSRFYEEILIDEYQDSNLLQEAILTAVSRNESNIYMVGDVKQSIYKFRMACPELFIEKYNSYSVYDKKADEEKASCAGAALIAENDSLAGSGAISAENDSLADSAAPARTAENSESWLKRSPVKIELQTNFRSRENVLECANDVFKRLMNEAYCGIAYDDDARLNAGLIYPESPKEIISGRNTFNTVDFGEDKQTCIYAFENDEGMDAESHETEADAVADIICSLMDGDRKHVVYDKNEPGNYRPIKYSDIVVLTRTVSGWADSFVNVLMARGIPAFSDTSEGYFNVREIQLATSFLTVIDNPLQDIPMSAVLLSYFGRFDTRELAFLRTEGKKEKIYTQLVRLVQENQNPVQESNKPERENQTPQRESSVESGGFKPESDGEYRDNVRRKAAAFLELLDKYRGKSEIMSVHDLLWEVLYDTGYYDYVGTMPAGRRRQANLDMLLDRAGAFERTSYKGLFNFLRYIEKLKKFDVEIGEASLLGENDNLVRVMSIHKSKGLEFPVVILAGMGKKINHRDASGEVVIDRQLGIGANVIRLSERTKKQTLIKSAISRKIIRENISEEMRILYVAMTRAREKLIITGTVSDEEKSLEEWKKKSEALAEKGVYSYADDASCAAFFDMLMPTALMPENQNKGSFKVIFGRPCKCKAPDDKNDMEAGGTGGETSDGHQAEETQITKDGQQEVQTVQEARITQDTRGKTQKSAEADFEPLPEYPYETEAEIKAKVTVSELKKLQQDTDIDEKLMRQSNIGFVDEDDEDEPVPVFIKGEETRLYGNERGTAYHRVMECLSFETLPAGGAEGKGGTAEAVKKQIDDMLATKRISPQQAESVSASDISAFCVSQIGERVRKASANKKLWREQPFVYMREKAEKKLQGQLIQGVIDLYFIEDGAVSIVDYKTDRVAKGKAGEEELKRRYRVQLEYYAEALSQLTGLSVKDRVIYSFALGKEIYL